MSEGFGIDIWATDALITGRLARGAAVVVQALYRRFITPRGTLRGITDDDPDFAYGFDVAAYVGAVGTATAIAALPGLMRAEAKKDDRIADVVFDVVATTDAAGLVTLLVTGAGVLADEDQPFALTLAVSDVTVSLLTGGTP